MVKSPSSDQASLLPPHRPRGAVNHLPGDLLLWYDRNRRHLPWRTAPGQTADPYHVWLSEIMLQQTTVVTVGPYFKRFLARWPSIADLAAAPLDEVLIEWAGLGYYARARNLHKCAVTITEQYGGCLPDSEPALLALPGIGVYTAAAIAAIAFDHPATPVDGNFERVMARLHAVEQPMPTAKSRLRDLAAALTPAHRPGDYAQAVMDLGATVCTPRNPKCMICPWSAACAARIAGIAEDLPRKSPKKRKPTRYGTAFWCLNSEGDVLLRRRPPSGLLGGMMEIPSTVWVEDPQKEGAATSQAPATADWRPLPGLVRHTFTHFHLELRVMATRVETASDMENARWHPISGLGRAGLPSVMIKIARHALSHADHGL
jgi:A/G-specific adenine glycosylase